MTQTACHADLMRFWGLLARGFCMGRPLLETLRSIRGSVAPTPMAAAVARLGDDVEQGASLSEAMRNQPDVFTTAHVNLVDGGERLGILDKVLLLVLEQTWRCPACGGLRSPGIE